MKIQANQLNSQLQKSLAPCYLVTGDEHLLVSEALDAIRDAARQQGFTSRDLHVTSASFDWVQLSNSTANLSLFAEKRIVELRLPTGKPGRTGGQAIVELIEQTGPDLLLLVSAPKLDRNSQSSKWAKALESAGAQYSALADQPARASGLDRRANAPCRFATGPRCAVSIIADRVEGNLLAAGPGNRKAQIAAWAKAKSALPT